MLKITVFLFYVLQWIRIINSDPSKILPCYTPYQIGAAQPLVVIYYTTLYDCLMSCLSGTEPCVSVIWDDRQHNCYLYGMSATSNPAILLNRYGTVYYERNANGPSQCGTIPGPVVPVVPVVPVNVSGPGLSCPSKSSTAYFVTPGADYPSQTQQSGTIQGVADENVCISSCTDQTSTATGAKIGCSSFTSVRSGNTVSCTFSTSSGPPDGTVALTANSQSFFFQKFCLPAGAPPTCAEQFFFLLPATSIAEHTVATSKATTVAECAGQCVTNPQCKSAVYDAGTSLCILKDITTTSPGGSSTNPNQYYLENGCLLGQRSAGGGGAAPPPPNGRALLSEFFQKVQVVKKKRFNGKSSTAKPDKDSSQEIEDPDADALLSEFTITTLSPLAEDESLTTVSHASATLIPRDLSSWGHWSICKFSIGGRKARVRTRDCTNFAKCPDKNIEFELCA